MGKNYGFVVQTEQTASSQKTELSLFGETWRGLRRYRRILKTIIMKACGLIPSDSDRDRSWARKNTVVKLVFSERRAVASISERLLVSQTVLSSALSINTVRTILNLLYLSQYLTNLMHKICFTIRFISCLYMFRAHVLIIRRSKLHYTASGIIKTIGVMIPEFV